MVRIGKANGLRLTTNRPEATFTAQEMSQFFTSYGLTLGAAPAAGDYPVVYNLPLGVAAGETVQQTPPGANDWACRPTAR